VTGRVAAPVLRRLLKDAPWARERLRPFAGHPVAWDIAGIKGELLLDSEGLPEVLKEQNTLDARRSSSGVFLVLPSEKLAVLGKGMDAVMREVRIEGNAGLAAELAFIARHLRPDPAEWMAPYLGDIGAEQLAKMLQQCFSWGAEVTLRLARSGTDYAVHEARLVLSSDMVSQHCDEIDVLRDTSDRLAQRIERLEARLKAKTNPY
jgi:ubiquinone biosynthesis protein UbiJ